MTMGSIFASIYKINSSSMTFSSFFFSRTIVGRIFFIVSIFTLFWLLFILFYWIRRWKRRSSAKICNVFVISSKEYGSFPSSVPEELQITNHFLEDYLRTSNPLMIDSKRTSTMINGELFKLCYSLACINKQTSIKARRYQRLSSSTSFTSPAPALLLPIVMITDCSDSQRLHTDILQFTDE